MIYSLKQLAGRYIAIVAFVHLAGVSHASDRLEVLTDAWPPYINAEGEPLGSAAHVLDLIGTEADAEVAWRYKPYGLAYQLVKRNKALLAYPYFRNQQRSGEVLFSEPVFSVRSRIYYNRRFIDGERVKRNFEQLRMGRVAGYSYGEQLDKLIKDPMIFPNELAALEALFTNDIDLLPMTEGVMYTTLQRHFPNREQLVLPIDGIEDESSLHVIAARTADGEAAIAKLNQALARLDDLGIAATPQSIDPNKKRLDLAKLIPAEGYPVILGRLSDDESNQQYFALPQGTRVIVLEWSDKIQRASDSDRLYKIMIDMSKVVILNGPHVGKVLFVRNMHIELL